MANIFLLQTFVDEIFGMELLSLKINQDNPSLFDSTVNVDYNQDCSKYCEGNEKDEIKKIGEIQEEN